MQHYNYGLMAEDANDGWVIDIHPCFIGNFSVLIWDAVEFCLKNFFFNIYLAKYLDKDLHHAY